MTAARLRAAADRLDVEATHDRANGAGRMALEKESSAAVFRAEADRMTRLSKAGAPAECRLDGCARSYLGNHCWRCGRPL